MFVSLPCDVNFIYSSSLDVFENYTVSLASGFLASVSTEWLYGRIFDGWGQMEKQVERPNLWYILCLKAESTWSAEKFRLVYTAESFLCLISLRDLQRFGSPNFWTLQNSRTCLPHFYLQNCSFFLFPSNLFLVLPYQMESIKNSTHY